MPTMNPVAAGTNESLPIWSLASRAGCSRLQNDAATMTPAAKPVRTFWTLGGISRLSTNTMAAPRLVPRKGRIITWAISETGMA